MQNGTSSRRPGIKLSIPAGNVPSNYIAGPVEQNGDWNIRPDVSRANVMATPPPRRPMLGLGSLTPRGPSPAPSRKLPALSLSIGAPSIAKEEPPSTDYNGGLRTPIEAYDRTQGQTTIRRSDDDNQRTVSAMTADLRNALSQMRITPPASKRSSLIESNNGSEYGDSESGSTSTSRKTEDLANLMDKQVTKTGVDLDARNYETIKRLGEGAGGAVELVKDKKSGAVLAMKIITTSPNPAIHKQLLRELQFLNECQSPYVVQHYGSFLTSSDTCIGILMEWCQAGSLDSLVRKITQRGGRTSEKVLAKIAEAVLKGLDYLHERRIIHRDIKPSNILLTKSGQVKLCDFGVSGELVDSFAGTFTGTSFYMAPERIQGLSYSIKSDIWSLGLTLHEVAHNRFPFPPEGEPPLSGPIELLNFIVAQPVPKLLDSPAQQIKWSDNAQDFLAKCLIRSADTRPYPRELIRHPWIVDISRRNVNLGKWVAAIHGWES